jgi:putative ABC transport system permease protein
MVFRESLLTVAIGITVGAAGAVALSHWIETMFFGVSKTDATTIIGAAFVFLSTAAIAAFLPARRASQMDPMRALRHE